VADLHPDGKADNKSNLAEPGTECWSAVVQAIKTTASGVGSPQRHLVAPHGPTRPDRVGRHMDTVPQLYRVSSTSGLEAPHSQFRRCRQAL
jgi:hypothetical protein